MTHRCIEPERAAEILALPEKDPRRIEAEGCPRCAAILLEYAEFMSGEAPPDADMEGADRRLAAYVDRLIEERMPAGAGGSPQKLAGGAHEDRAGDGSGEGAGGWLRRLLAPHPALAAAAVLAVAVITIAVWRPWTPGERVLRGDEPAELRITTLAPAVSPDGSVTLSWLPVDGADEYIVEIRSGRLDELAVLGPVTETAVTFARGDLPGGARGTVLWRVRALRGGDKIAASPPTSLELP